MRFSQYRGHSRVTTLVNADAPKLIRKREESFLSLSLSLSFPYAPAAPVKRDKRGTQNARDALEAGFRVPLAIPSVRSGGGNLVRK